MPSALLVPRLRRLAALLLGVALLAGGAEAKTWAGVNATSQGFGAHLGSSLLSALSVGTLGLEGSYERGWLGRPSRYAAGVTLRDLNLPLTSVDAFVSAGAEYRSGGRWYVEGGLRGELLGAAGWRGFVRGSGTGRDTARYGAGLGLELRVGR